MPGHQGAAGATDRIRVEAEATTGKAYDVIIRPASYHRLPALLESCDTAHRTVIITDETVGSLYGDRLAQAFSAVGVPVETLTVPAGEASKSRETWARLTDQLTGMGFGRDSRVIALGGGVIGDLAGFVAATYMRGVAFVNVPTTLLAMIDASVGGKTGVDTPAGKNLVGAFHQPDLVLIDPEVLATLPAGTFQAGLAEAVKHGIVADAAYADWIDRNAAAILRRDQAAVTQLIEQSVRIKAGVVAADTRETGVRSILNFGHTIGHAIEHVSDWSVSHGHAVAIGMSIEARLGEHMGVTGSGTSVAIDRALTRLGLPTDMSGMGIDWRSLVAATHSDKKARSAVVRYVLPAAVGRVARTAEGAWTWPVQDSVVAAVLTSAAGAGRAISQVETDV